MTTNWDAKAEALAWLNQKHAPLFDSRDELSKVEARVTNRLAVRLQRVFDAGAAQERERQKPECRGPHD